MSIAYPTALDAITPPTPGLPLGQAQGGRTQTGYVTDVLAIGAALEAKVGVDQSAVTSSHEYRLRGAPHSRATDTIAATTTTAKTVSVAGNKVRADCTARVRVTIGDFPVNPSRISVNGARDTITITAETIGGTSIPFIEGDAVLVEYCGEGA